MINKIPMMIFVLFALGALGALTAGAAPAETTLLAEWLWTRGGVTEGIKELTSIEVRGTLLLEDTETIAGAADLECTATAKGSVGSDGEGEIVEILNVNGEKVASLGGLALLGTGAASGEGSECKTVKTCAAGTAASPIEVWPIGLPWHTLLFLMEDGKILNLLFSETLSEPESGVSGLFVGYELLCLVLGINTEDACWEEDFEVEVQNDLVTGDAATPNGAILSPNALCSQSGLKPTGTNVAVGTTLILPLEGLLTVSSE